MKALVVSGALASALLLAGCGGDAGAGNSGSDSATGGASGQTAAIPAPNGGDWTTVVSATPEGGFVMGNPNAPVKLVEFASMTCPHCASFAAEGMPALRDNYIKSGRVSLEFRNFVRDPYDLTGALLSRCAGPANFFALTDRIFGTQDAWIARVKPQVAAIGALPENQRLARIASVSGMEALAAKAGVPAARAKQCLSDPKGTEKLVQMRKVAVDTYGLEGTPTFILNGKNTGVYDWAALKPLLGPPGS